MSEFNAEPRQVVAEILRELADKIEQGELLTIAVNWDGVAHIPQMTGTLDLHRAYLTALTEDATTPTEEPTDAPKN